MNNENNVAQANINVPTQKDNGGKNGGKQPRARRDIKAEAAMCWRSSTHAHPTRRMPCV